MQVRRHEYPARCQCHVHALCKHVAEVADDFRAEQVGRWYTSYVVDRTILADRMFQQAIQDMGTKQTNYCAYHDPCGKCVKNTGALQLLWKPCLPARHTSSLTYLQFPRKQEIRSKKIFAIQPLVHPNSKHSPLEPGYKIYLTQPVACQ